MKYTLITAMLAGLVCVGCNTSKKTVQTGPPPEAIPAVPGETVKPLAPPGGEIAPPAPATNLTSLVPPEPKPATGVTMPPTPPAPPAPLTPPATAGGTYTIKKGDTFIKIAREVYGDPSRMKDIAAANPGVDPRKLKVGQTIILPDAEPQK
jgi:nucleoid-associated protein YgaU